MADDNVDKQVVDDFGSEWSRFDQGDVDEGELRAIFEAYFRIFPWDSLPDAAVGFDLGAGSGEPGVGERR